MNRDTIETRAVDIAAGDVELRGDLSIPHPARGLVIFAHGSGSSRTSPRNREVAQALGAAGLATLLFDLLTAEEERIDAVTRELRFDIGLLTRRLAAVVEWAHGQAATRDLPIGLFGASTGAAAALDAAARRPDLVRCVVSRGGRPDLAAEALGTVAAPTLLVVGGDDVEVLQLNREAARRLEHATVAIVPGATHLFEEPGALDEVARLAQKWFARHLFAASEGAAAPDDPPPTRLPFADRRAAGVQLAHRLAGFAGHEKVIVLGLPRGGVPVAEEVARALRAPLDVVVVRKLGTPGHRELAMGAIAPGVCVLNPEVVAYVSERDVEEATLRESVEMERRERIFRAGRAALDVRGAIVLLVDDGLATGATMRAAVAWARAQKAARVVVAVPVAPVETLELLEHEADEVVCLATPPDFRAVGLYYREFDQVTEDEVTQILSAGEPLSAASP